MVKLLGLKMRVCAEKTRGSMQTQVIELCQDLRIRAQSEYGQRA
jgi:hypothetical protein